jgi:hypothetical protein
VEEEEGAWGPDGKKQGEEKPLTGGSTQNENQSSKIFNWTELNWFKNGLFSSNNFK